MRKKKITVERVEKAEKAFHRCPFCKNRPRLVIQDDEGNYRGHWDDDMAASYIEDPWSGLWFVIEHDEGNACPVSTGDIADFGGYHCSYETPEEAVKHWNERAE